MIGDATAQVPDARGAGAPFLVETAAAGSQLIDLAQGLLILARHTEKLFDDDQLIQIEEWLIQQWQSVQHSLTDLKSRFRSLLYPLSRFPYPIAMKGLLDGLLTESSGLLERETPCDSTETEPFALKLLDLGKRLRQVGTDPDAAMRAPEPEWYREERLARLEQRLYEWPNASTIGAPVYSDPDPTLIEFLAGSNIAPAPLRILSENEIPADYRDGGLPDGNPLFVEFVGRPETYGLSGPYLSANYRGPRLKLEKRYIYHHVEVAALSDRRNCRDRGKD